MRRSKTTLWSIGLVLAFIVGARTVVAHKQETVKPNAHGGIRTLKYRVARTERTVSGEPTLLVYISVDPQYFNRDDLIMLGHQLNRDFSREPRLTVLIFSNYRAAKSLVFSIERPSNYDRNYAALRGGYNLDRPAGKEYVSFSPNPRKPHDEVKIELSNVGND